MWKLFYLQDGFKMICHFERHEKSHDEEKPFVCHLCNKTFKYAENNQFIYAVAVVTQARVSADIELLKSVQWEYACPLTHT